MAERAMAECTTTERATTEFVPGIPMEVTVFQCSKCRMQSLRRSVIDLHIRNRTRDVGCRDAEVVQGTFAFTPGGTAAPGTIVGDRNTVNSHNTTTYNITNEYKVYVGSWEERAALIDVLKDPANLEELSRRQPEDIPAALFRMWKGTGAPDAMKNIKVLGDRVEEVRGPDTVVSVPRGKFVKKTMGDMFSAVAGAPPAITPAPDKMTKIHDELNREDLPLGKKRRVSRLDAAKMHAMCSPDAYKLGTEGREFLSDATARMNRELDFYSPRKGQDRSGHKGGQDRSGHKGGHTTDRDARSA